ncbi:MAG: hypothetical protein LBR25_09900 [Erysipelotrichaceae bacterium]|jgi:hypothetical protein|nr:hypothetical protein [Erysipelotrichaceae bacterium]
MKQEPTEAALAAVGIPRLKPWGGCQAFSEEKVNQLLLAPKDCVDLSVALNQALDEILVNGKSFR